MSARCNEKFGDAVEGVIGGAYSKIGRFVGNRPRLTIAISIIVTVLCAVGLMNFNAESRPEELWVPQDNRAEYETEQFEVYFPKTSRFNQIIVQSSDESNNNVLTKTILEQAILMHTEIETKTSTSGNQTDNLVSLCTKAGGTCADNSASQVCQCLITSILRQWNYDLATLQNDTDYMTTLQQYGTREDLEAVLGNSVWNDNNELVSAEAFTISYFLQDRSEVVDGQQQDPVNEAWEEQCFLGVTVNVDQNSNYDSITIDYFAGRSFEDEFGDAISGDIRLVIISFVLVFVFVGATIGKIKCGTGSRWTLALAALVLVGLATVAGFGISSAFSLIFSPVHNLLPFVLLGIGVDDAFVLVNAFDRERKVARALESNKDLTDRTSRAMARAGSSILVTSLTDLVAFAISATSSLPALSSFGAYAAISIFFLWAYASTFFSACLNFDERRQRDNHRELFCCLTRHRDPEDEEYKEGLISRYFRKFHAPTILSRPGKVLVLIVFAGLVGFGIYGTTELSVEDSSRSFIPAGSYVNDYIDATDEYFPEQGIDLYITFQGSSEIYADRVALSELESRLTGLSTSPPYISEPVSEEAYRNVMDGLAQYLATSGTSAIGGATLGDDGWPTTETDFIETLSLYASISGPGAVYAQDVSFSEDRAALQAYRVRLEYVKLVKERRGEVIPDADKQIDAMDATRSMVESWTDLPPAFAYSDEFQSIEGYKVIRRDLFLNVGTALAAVTVIVFFTVANVWTALLIALNVAFCIVEILGFMWLLGIVIDSVSVINLVLAVGLSVDYSAHTGHCFMTKGGADKNKRVTEALCDIGAAVLQGGISTFLAVVVLLFSNSYVFWVLSRQFALTVALGLMHGLLCLPVMLSLVGPKPYSSAESTDVEDEAVEKPGETTTDKIGSTAHQDAMESSSDDDGSADIDKVDTAVKVDEDEVHDA